MDIIIKNVKYVESSTKIVSAVLDTQTFKIQDDLLIYKCWFCNRNYEKRVDEDLSKWFANMYTLSALNKSTLILWKDVYPYKYMDDWKKFGEILSPEKEDFYISQNMEDITDADYRHAKRVWNKYLGWKA